MSKEALAKVVQRAISDAGFRRQLNSDPAGALRGFDLSADELSALRTGNAGRLSTLGIDQRMSKAFAIGGAVAATRMAQSDLTAGSPAMVDDASGLGSSTKIPVYPTTDASADASGSEAMRAKLPTDPDRVVTADIDGGSGTSTVRAGGDDYKFAGRQAPEAAGTRTGDDWKFTDRAATQGSVAPIEGSPEATAAELGRGGGMANYPAHHGLAGQSGTESVRAGDDYARSARIDDSGRSGTARLDDATGGASGGATVNDDPDGFLAANANADLSGSVVRSNVSDDPDGFLAANANADLSGSVVRSNVSDDPDGFLAANANADLSGGTSRGDGTAFVDESEAYLTKVGYDASAASTKANATWSGDENAGPTSVADDDDGGATSGGSASESGPNIDH